MTKKAPEQVKILGVGVSSTTELQVLAFFRDNLKKNKKIFITTPNPEIILRAQRDEILLKSLNKSDIAVPDGTGVLWAAKFLNNPLKSRIKGRELMIKLLEHANNEQLKVFFLGASPLVNEKAVKKAKVQYPNALVFGNSGPRLNDEVQPVTEADSKSQIEVVNHINEVKPDILFVAFGAPKQEKWSYKWLPKIKVKSIMVIGGSLDYFVGSAVLPPRWMARVGLEWLWRLLKNPARIKRIFNAVIVFPTLVIKEKLSK